MRYLFCLLILASCARHYPTSSNSSTLSQLSHRPTVAILPMEDSRGDKFLTNVSQALTHSIQARIAQKNQLHLSSLKNEPKQFLVSMQLLNYKEAVHNPLELTIGVHVKIEDIRFDKPQIVFQEVINHTTLLEESLPTDHVLMWQAQEFRVSPIGLAHAKVAREVANRIEEYIKLAIKG